MEPLALLGVVGSLASITGLNATEAMKRLQKPRGALREFLLPPVIKLLSIYDPADGLVGLWTVREWPYQRLNPRDNKLEAWHVSGFLAVLFKYPKEERWQAVLTLSFRRVLDGSTHWLAREWRRRRGDAFDGAYNVVIQKQTDKYGASLSQFYRYPDDGGRRTGEFRDLILKCGASISGSFRNIDPRRKGEKRELEVAFHQPKLWSQVQTS